jgi:hypothetical protein
VLALMIGGGLRREQLTTRQASLDDAPRVIGAHVRGRETKTVLVDPATAAG